MTFLFIQDVVIQFMKLKGVMHYDIDTTLTSSIGDGGAAVRRWDTVLINRSGELKSVALAAAAAPPPLKYPATRVVAAVVSGVMLALHRRRSMSIRLSARTPRSGDKNEKLPLRPPALRLKLPRRGRTSRFAPAMGRIGLTVMLFFVVDEGGGGVEGRGASAPKTTPDMRESNVVGAVGPCECLLASCSSPDVDRQRLFFASAVVGNAGAAAAYERTASMSSPDMKLARAASSEFRVRATSRTARAQEAASPGTSAAAAAAASLVPSVAVLGGARRSVRMRSTNEGSERRRSATEVGEAEQRTSRGVVEEEEVVEEVEETVEIGQGVPARHEVIRDAAEKREVEKVGEGGVSLCTGETEAGLSMCSAGGL